MNRIRTFTSLGINLLRTALTASGVRAKFVVALFYLVYLHNSYVRRYFPLPWRLPNILLADVTLRTPWGCFRCRKGTSDAWIAGPGFEPTTRSYLHSVVQNGTFVDVGGHIGRYAIEMGRWLGDQGNVVVIEPHPDSFRVLETNVQLNGLTNVTTLNLGCWSTSGSLTLEGQYDTARLTASTNAEGQEVQVASLDEILLERLGINRIAVLKIDVEGGEPQVLRGAKRVLGSNPGIKIVFEALDGEMLADIVQVLEPAGFKIKQISWKNFVAERPLSGPLESNSMRAAALL
jgi:FkbM family methyltransferase